MISPTIATDKPLVPIVDSLMESAQPSPSHHHKRVAINGDNSSLLFVYNPLNLIVSQILYDDFV